MVNLHFFDSLTCNVNNFGFLNGVLDGGMLQFWG